MNVSAVVAAAAATVAAVGSSNTRIKVGQCTRLARAGNNRTLAAVTSDDNDDDDDHTHCLSTPVLLVNFVRPSRRNIIISVFVFSYLCSPYARQKKPLQITRYTTAIATAAAAGT